MTLQIKAMYATAKNSYIKISSGVKAYEIERNTSDQRYIAAMGRVSTLPEAPTANPKSVTDNIDLPSEFEWVSGNETVCGQ